MPLWQAFIAAIVSLLLLVAAPFFGIWVGTTVGTALRDAGVRIYYEEVDEDV